MKTLDTNILNEAQKNGAYPIELVSFELDNNAVGTTFSGTTVDIPGGAILEVNGNSLQIEGQSVTVDEALEALPDTGVVTLSGINHNYTAASPNAGNIRFSITGFDGGDVAADLAVTVVYGITESDNLYLNTGYNSITYNGNTYSAGAGVLGLSPVEETLDTKTNSISIELNGLPIDYDGVRTTLIRLLEGTETSPIRTVGGIVTIYQSFVDQNTGLPINKTDGTPAIYQKWQGIIYSFATTEENQGENAIRISVECKNILVGLLDTKSGRFTSQASFEQSNPNDKSMEFVASTINFNPQFGSEE